MSAALRPQQLILLQQRPRATEQRAEGQLLTTGSAGADLPAVKYLSSPKLMRLQLQDAAFRRHFLIQVATAALRACLLQQRFL